LLNMANIECGQENAGDFGRSPLSAYPATLCAEGWKETEKRALAGQNRGKWQLPTGPLPPNPEREIPKWRSSGRISISQKSFKHERSPTKISFPAKQTGYRAERWHQLSQKIWITNCLPEIKHFLPRYSCRKLHVNCRKPVAKISCMQESGKPPVSSDLIQLCFTKKKKNAMKIWKHRDRTDGNSLPRSELSEAHLLSDRILDITENETLQVELCSEDLQALVCKVESLRALLHDTFWENLEINLVELRTSHQYFSTKRRWCNQGNVFHSSLNWDNFWGEFDKPVLLLY